jgi:hypothetical protein
MASRAVRVARRSFLAGAALLLANQGTQVPTCRAPADDPFRQEVGRFLAAMGSNDAPPYEVRPALAALRANLPAALLDQVEAAARASCLSPDDWLTYNALEALPLAPDLLSLYLPRGLAFVVRRQPGQGGLLGAAFLATAEPLRWLSDQGFSSLRCGSSLGAYIGVNSGLAMVTLAAPSAGWLGPGMPSGLACRLLLEQARSTTGALRLLSDLRPARPCRHVLYDPVEGTGQMIEIERSSRLLPLSAPVHVLATPEESASDNATRLDEALRANLGWLRSTKALSLLQGAMPGATCLVLDAEERLCLLADGSETRAIGY